LTWAQKSFRWGQATCNCSREILAERSRIPLVDRAIFTLIPVDPLETQPTNLIESHRIFYGERGIGSTWTIPVFRG